ncbi:hypothetical protein AYI68_g6110 [Smittium mucronatum]|uniref:Uncharacterized protein n=1 Tax=Smittium mucronatum TaxID=133383 RepID=A0A1R0GSE8_9FUNG|nr:hypothetical protein AYI68_g6110 [Smittium mucronatum]
MSEVTNSKLNELTALFSQLMREREPQLEEEDPFVTPRIPITELSVYAELSEALSSTDEDFFRTPQSDEDRKTALYTCPKTCSMKYFPPPLNESTSTADKKLDSTLYAIQTALAQETRPIDYNVHRNIQENLGIIVIEDPEITFANTMRVLLSEIATSETHNRLDNLHKGMELPGRVKQILETDTKLLMDQDALDSLLSNKKTETRKRRFQPFPASTSAPNNRPQKSQQNFCGRGRGRGSYERGIQDPIQEPIPNEAKIGESDTHDLGKFEKENSKKWSKGFIAFGGETFTPFLRIFFFNDDEIAKNFGPCGPKFLG